MSNKGYDPAFPIPHPDRGVSQTPIGLTKREYFAIKIYAALLVCGSNTSPSTNEREDTANTAVDAADALLKALE